MTAEIKNLLSPIILAQKANRRVAYQVEASPTYHGLIRLCE